MSAEIYLQLVFGTKLVCALYFVTSYTSTLNCFIFVCSCVFSDPNTTLLVTSLYKAKTHGFFVTVKFSFFLRTNLFHQQTCLSCSPSVMERFSIQVTVSSHDLQSSLYCGCADGNASRSVTRFAKLWSALKYRYKYWMDGHDI